MADMKQMKMKVDKLRADIENIDEQIDKHHAAINKLRVDKENLEKQVDDITGVDESSDGGITTTTAGNISKLGGSGNYAPKIGMTMKRKTKKKKKNENAAIDYLDKFLD